MTELETSLADNRAAVADFVAAARAVDPRIWTTPPGEGKWSPAQIAEHLAIVYEYSRAVVLGTAGKGLPRFLRPLLRRFAVDPTLKAGKSTRKGKAPRFLRPSPTPPAPAADLLARLGDALTGFEGDIRSGHPAGRHTITHPFFGTMPTTDYVRFQAIHTRHHRAQLPAADGHR